DQEGALSLNSFVFAGGSGTAELSYNKWGTIKLIVTDPDNPAAEVSCPDMQFNPKEFGITFSDPPPKRDFFYLNEDITLTITALDADNAVIPNYQGSVSFTPAEGLVLPEQPYEFTSEDQGKHVFSLFSNKEGQFTVKVNDTSHTSVIGISTPIASRYAKIVVESQNALVGEPADIFVRLVDSKGDLVLSDESTTFIVSLTESISNESASTKAVTIPVSIKAGLGTFKLTDNQVETVTVSVESTPELPFETGIITFTEDARRMGEGGVRIIYWKEAKDEKR
ncbi:MAG: hypothetical protein JW774_00540, partial [Candidatus Aureabacteria bacterium]|nr:hypothetical protein [Candidatus Auribacterota bacterium]